FDALREDQPAGAIAQAPHLGDAPPELGIHAELEAFLALAVRRDEAQQRSREIAIRVESVPLAFERQAGDRVALVAVAERPHPGARVARWARLQPNETGAPSELLGDLVARKAQRVCEPLRVLSDPDRHVLLVDAAEHLDCVDRKARYLDALREDVAAAIV